MKGAYRRKKKKKKSQSERDKGSRKTKHPSMLGEGGGKKNFGGERGKGTEGLNIGGGKKEKKKFALYSFLVQKRKGGRGKFQERIEGRPRK